MSDETSGATTRVEGASGAAGSGTTERVGFCQDCGTALTRETVKTVGSGVFCEPCLEKRLGTAPQGAAGASAGAATGAGYGSSYVGSSAYAGAMPPGAAGADGEPSPALAGVLGLIPGVGAVYNGQYAKGLIHFVIFAILVLLQKDVSDVFGLFVLAWIIYMMVDAHHTAKARRDGLELPDPFGFNEMGDRMGFGRGWVGSATRPQAGAGRNAAKAAAAAQAPGDVAAWGAPMTSGVPPVPPAASVPPAANVPPQPYAGQAGYAVPPANWAGYVSPAAFASAPPVPPVPPAGASVPPSSWGATPYPAAYGAAQASSYANGPAVPPMPPVPSTPRFPVGALWLIGLGVLVLAKTLTPEWDFSGLWIVAGVLAGMAVWVFMRRLSLMGGAAGLHEGNAPQLVCTLRGPVVMLTLAVMFALQAAHVMTIGQSWPVLLIVFGVVVLMERTIGTGTVYGGPMGAYVPPAGYSSGPVTGSGTNDSAPGGDASKGGQG